ncbi:hypothetical protein BWQ96_08523 [Gracilariopsis chorda]|uniref:Uncharacterized protein n=1 Tax=Gracilariopsis chorda TaxID=448386 RepID=A0A2V3II16_9FLOR|nr:hypothetical protein BWQ96_08523 [Gracilariopsis chorda]|eukprot:PXF41734.1 hypothetical protein BWQ96_08523 [Gracilariopsis chorda]
MSEVCAGYVTWHERVTEREKCPTGKLTYGTGDSECFTLGSASAAVSFNDLLELSARMELEDASE